MHVNHLFHPPGEEYEKKYEINLVRFKNRPLCYVETAIYRENFHE